MDLLTGLEVHLLSATHLPKYSSAGAFAAVASMALDEALVHAAPIVVEPWVSIFDYRSKIMQLSETLDTLTKFLGTVRAEISSGAYFTLDIEIPARLKRKVASALGLGDLETYSTGQSGEIQTIVRTARPADFTGCARRLDLTQKMT